MEHLALRFAATIRHDGHGGVADDLATDEGFRAWAGENLGAGDGDREQREQVVALRRAVRSLFAHAVRREGPGKVDSAQLIDPRIALDHVNAAAAGVLRAPQLDWPDGGEPEVRYVTTDGDDLLAALARSAVEFLGSDAREKLRACPAPRCIRYFVKEHPQQAWCKPSCGNRARVSRYYKRRSESV